MSTKLPGLVAEILRQRVQKRIEFEKKQQQLNSLRVALRSCCEKISRTPSITDAKIVENHFISSMEALTKAEKILQLTLKHFLADNIRICVFKLIVEGKRQVLLTLTELGEKELSIGDEVVQSIVRIGMPQSPIHFLEMPENDKLITSESSEFASLARILSENTDIAFLIRSPQSIKDDIWSIADLEIQNMLMDIYPRESIPPKDWMRLILNSKERSNFYNADEASINKLVYIDFPPLVCDCTSEEAVLKMLKSALIPLLKKVKDLDSFRLCQAKEAFDTAYNKTEKVLDALLQVRSSKDASDTQSASKATADDFGVTELQALLSIEPT